MSTDRLDRNEKIVFGAGACLALVYVAASGLSGPALFCAFLTAAVILLRRAEYRVDKDLPRLGILRLVWTVLMCLMPLAFHLGTGQAVISTGKPLWDKELLAADEWILGFVFPQGQLALWTDGDPMLNPSAFLGRVITEILQVAYFTYYLWGNLIVVYLALQYWRDVSNIAKWRRLRQMALALVAAYILNFTINFIIPAVSPRLFIHDAYKHDFEGLFVGKFLQNAIKSAAGGDPSKPKSFGAFPSGHVGITWLAAMAAQRLGLTRYAVLARIAAVLMTLAVVYLRYHYAVDAFAAAVLPLTGLWIGRLFPRQRREDESRNTLPL